MVRRFGITNPMAPSLPSALGASEVSLTEIVSAYSTFPNKGVRVQPHLIRKVFSRDGSLLEEWKGTTYKVTSEYVAGTMVDMLRGVTGAGGTAPGASASGQPLAGKTGTVNDQTDVWFIGFTPTYVTGVWMGNPERKESLGAGMTGGGGALPYFNAFMAPFMKGKEKETFYKTPPMTSDIKALAEQRRREEMEKLEKAEEAGKTLGISFNAGPKTRRNVDKTITTDGGLPLEPTLPLTTTDVSKPADNPKPNSDLQNDVPKPPPPAPVKKAEPQPEKPKAEGVKPKGKKGDDDNDN
jgi:penicillin-binding protein 1A